VSSEDRHRVVQWLDCNSLRLGSYIREEAQLRGELVWPCMDVDPANVQGIDGTQPGLKGNFWHENTYGPYPVLFSEHAHDRVAIMDRDGAIVWEYSVPHPQDVWMLPNGHILTTYYQGVREVTRDKEIVWEYRTEKPNEIPNCQPLPDGNVMIGVVGECRLIEVNRQGAIVHQVQLSTAEKTPHAQFRLCRKTREGTYLVPFTAEGAVREYDGDGKVIREFPRRPTPVCALRLENGNTLISADRAVTEYDRNDKVVWELREHEIPDIQIGVFAGIHRLDNGDTIMCNWNTQDIDGKMGAHLLQVTDDKRVVWQVTGTHIGQMAQCQLLTDDLAGPRYPAE
ncbi:MAG: PQQ-binding-like beta-propeller repeat protein, partial [Candidatus Hydrogenedentes bacterium]|nr:PQQ-binding-like beta-propeller repeat protein [Candidatus Hydrogenedentota bacterium]